MCLIICAYQYQSKFPLVVAANRDEFFSRPTQSAGLWQGNEPSKAVLAGKDLTQGGTWLGINPGGHFAAVTNIRNPDKSSSGEKSRGFLVSDFLQSEIPAQDYLQGLISSLDLFAGFNLLLGDDEGLYYLNNMDRAVRKLPPGIYGLSNGTLDSPWPKVNRGKSQVQDLLDSGKDVDTHTLIKIMTNKDIAPDVQLPDTGIPLELERLLSASFINNPQRDYGTRCSTAIVMNDQRNIRFSEQNYGRDTSVTSRRYFDFSLN